MRGLGGALVLISALASAGSFAAEDAQQMARVARRTPLNVVVPQRRTFSVDQTGQVQIVDVAVNIAILEQSATTTLEISLKNPTAIRQEAELLVPVPDGAVVRSFAFQGGSQEPTARLLPKDEATRTYENIVAQSKDPALLEFAGYNLVKSSVFPLEPHGAQKVRLIYEHLLSADGTRVDYVLPRSEALDYNLPWTIQASIVARKAIATVYSPSHKLEVKREDAGKVKLSVAKEARTEPGPFRLSFLLSDDGLSASLFAYPDPKVGGGYFLLVAGVPAQPPLESAGTQALKREVTLVIDRSGSMAGEKIEQVKRAAQQIVGGLQDGEAFNLIAYNEYAEMFAKEPVIKSQETAQAALDYISHILPRGGTNIHDALLEALRQKPAPSCLPIVLFLTDGLPTVGQTAETTIRELATKANPHQRRVFTFGVGLDVNTPLLEKVAAQTRATATFVLPKEDVEVSVGRVFKRLAGPVLASPSIVAVDAAGKPALGRVRDILPAVVPDLFEGDQLVLLGVYNDEQPVTFRLEGNYFGKSRTFEFKFELDKATTRHAFVPRLWASRKIAVLVEAIRSLGAEGADFRNRKNARNDDPRIKELVGAIVSLSREFGVLTEYTAFLALEGQDLGLQLDQALDNLRQRAMDTRRGQGSFNQDTNIAAQRQQKELNSRNGYLNENLEQVQVTTVQQINDRAFFNRNGRWIDSRVLDDPAQPKRTVEVGSAEHMALTRKLSEQGRAGSLSLKGEIMLDVDGEKVLVR